MSKPNPPDFLSTFKNPPNPPGMACNPDKYLVGGALGGAMVGFMTGFFRLDRVNTPVSPFPASSSKQVHESTKLLVKASSVGWRVTKRMFVGSILFPFLVCQLQGNQKTPGIVRSAIAGGMTGAIFGLRGGPSGVINGTAFFAIFSGLTETFRIFKGDA